LFFIICLLINNFKDNAAFDSETTVPFERDPTDQNAVELRERIAHQI